MREFRWTERWKKGSKRRGMRGGRGRKDSNDEKERVTRDAPSGYVKRLEVDCW